MFDDKSQEKHLWSVVSLANIYILEFDNCVTRSWDRYATGILDQRSGDNVSQYPQRSTGLS